MYATIAVAGLILAITAPAAEAAATRAEYVADAERVCQTATKQAKKALRRVDFSKLERIADLEEPDKFFRFLAKVNGLTNKPFGRMVKRLYALEPAPEDEVLVAQWLDGLGDAKRLTDRSVRSTFRGKYARAFRFESQAIDALVGGARFVNGFGFKRCPGGELITDDTLASAASHGWTR